MKNFIFLVLVTVFLLLPIKSEADYSKLDEVAPVFLEAMETSLKLDISKRDLPDVSARDMERIGLTGDANQKKGVATFYFTGVGGVRQNYRKAFKWFRRSAKLGDSTAQLYVSLMYSTGKGIGQDSFLARKWLKTCVSADNEACLSIRETLRSFK